MTNIFSMLFFFAFDSELILGEILWDQIFTAVGDLALVKSNALEGLLIYDMITILTIFALRNRYMCFGLLSRTTYLVYHSNFVNARIIQCYRVGAKGNTGETFNNIYAE